MYSPQTEDGYTKIANELLEAFAIMNVSGSAWRVFMVVLRKTYGFRKKEDAISLTQFESMSKLTRMSVCRGIQELEKSNVLNVQKKGYINIYKVQKDYSKWGSIKPVTSNKNDTKSSIKPVTKTSNKNDTHKRKKEIKEICKDKSLPVIGNKKKVMPWNRYNENEHQDDLPSIGDDGEIEKRTKGTRRNYKKIYAVFEEVLGDPNPMNWTVNATQQKCAENLYKERGVEEVKKALLLYLSLRDQDYCPHISSPYDLDSKWDKLHLVKKETKSVSQVEASVDIRL